MQTLRPRRPRRELTRLKFPNAEAVKKDFGDRIRAGRIKAELTQCQLAETVGVSTAQIGHIEMGRNMPSLTVLIVLARALKLEIPLAKL